VAGPVVDRLGGAHRLARRFEICTRENRRMLQGTATSLLAVCGLAKAYNGRVIVDGLDLKVEAGSAVALMGPNGCGKSTVLRCLSGHEQGTHTTFETAGRPAHSSAYRRDVFPIFDDFSFFPDITVAEHLELLAGMHDVPEHEATAAAALARFGISGVAEQFPTELSSGQIRRVAFAAAAIRPWKLLLLDEPEQRLDVDGRSRLVQFLQEQMAAGRGLVFATHDAGLAQLLGARVVTLAHQG
jgi:ABC-2 type transport system ATP-binding protein